MARAERILKQVEKINELNNRIEEDGLSRNEKLEKRTLEYGILKKVNINEKIVLLLLNGLVNNRVYDWDLIANLLGMKKQTFNLTIKRLVEKGYVEKNGRGKKAKYSLNKAEVSTYKLYYTVMELYSRMTNKEKLVYIYIRSFGKRKLKEGWYFYSKGYKFYRCSNKLIENDLGISEPTINECIKSLEKSGNLSIFREYRSDGGFNRYFILENNL